MYEDLCLLLYCNRIIYVRHRDYAGVSLGSSWRGKTLLVKKGSSSVPAANVTLPLSHREGLLLA